MAYPWQQWQPTPIDPALLMAQQAPPGPPLGLLGMLSPDDVQHIPLATQGPMPTPAAVPAAVTQPSILDRVLGRLFPTPSGLDPAAAHQLQRQGLLQVGTSLMRSGAWTCRGWSTTPWPSKPTRSSKLTRRSKRRSCRASNRRCLVRTCKAG